ncbi:MAG: hypothetical protein QNK98_00475 [Yoonia sp.]
MTREEIKTEDNKIRAEIANLNALSTKLAAETFKLNAEGAKINTENRWYLLVVGSGATLAIVAIVNIFM